MSYQPFQRIQKDERALKMLAMYQSGMSYRDIEDYYKKKGEDIHYTTIGRHIKKAIKKLSTVATVCTDN